MKRLLPLLLLVTGCTPAKLDSLAEQHRAWVCRNPALVTATANATIANASAIKDANIRAAVIAIARNDLTILAACGTTAP